MIDTIRSEWIKLRSVRSTVILLIIGGALTIGIALIAINEIQNDDPPLRLSQITIGVSLSAFLFGALGVQIIGQEYRFNTIRSTLSATPNRVRVLVAKMIVVAVAVFVVAFVMMLICVALGSVFLDNFEMDGVDMRILWATPLFAAGWSLMGLGVGAILRQPVAGIIVLLAEGFVVESIVANVVHGTAKWLPFSNGVLMTIRDSSDPGDEIQFRGTLDGGIYFFLVVAVVLAIGVVVAQRRDA